MAALGVVLHSRALVQAVQGAYLVVEVTALVVRVPVQGQTAGLRLTPVLTFLQSCFLQLDQVVADDEPADDRWRPLADWTVDSGQPVSGRATKRR